MGGTKAERKVKMLTAKKESLFLILQELIDLSKKLTTRADKDKFLVLYHSVDSTRESLVGVVDEINEASFEVDEEFTPDYKFLSTINEMCCHIHSSAATLKRSEEDASQFSRGQNQNLPNKVLPTLPRIELPEFSGEVREWETFYELFKSMIHENTTLNNTDKVHYLIGRLRGAALSICSGIAPTGDNYDILWGALVDKFQDKRYLANSYLDQIMNFKPLTMESSRNLNLFLERFDSAVNALKKLKLPDLADFVLFYEARNKLDNATVKAFDSFKRGKDVPTYDELVLFVKEQSKILNVNKLSSSGPPSGSKQKFFAGQVRGEKQSCVFCKQTGHYLARCEKFKALTPSKRYEAVKNNHWCFNCLASNHGVRNCSSERTCSECSKKHHILLHLGKPDFRGAVRNEEQTDANGDTGAQILCTTSVRATYRFSTVLLPTVVVNILNSGLQCATARFILDSGSQVNLLTLRCCRRLGLKISRTFSSVHGLGQNPQTVRGRTNLVIGSRYETDQIFDISATVVDKVTDKLPSCSVQSKECSADFQDIFLADSNFAEPSDIDGIIGAELFSCIMRKRTIQGEGGSPVALETAFGYVITGRVPMDSPSHSSTFFTQQEENNMEDCLKKFWELEQVPSRALTDPEDTECEELFQAALVRDEVSGRFTVALPFRYSAKNLRDSKQNAVVRLFSLEKRLARFPYLRLEYNKAMKDFIDQGHMQLVENDCSNDLAYYIAHHAVIKTESSSTPLRVVMDASAASDSDVSLNDLLYSGPKLQADICTVLLNFRLFEVALTADIRQMYRQIGIVKEHWPFQRLLWRSDPGDKIETYEITVVAFGVKSSPYLALRVVQELTEREKSRFPIAAKHIGRDLYMDDLVASISSVESAGQLYQQSVELFAAGGFELTKFSTNSVEILGKIPINSRLSKDVVFKSDTKILGMQWNPELDTFTFKLDKPGKKCTKRSILSAVARCYDPIGLIAPFILFLKLLVKELWNLQLGWDEDPPEHVRCIWENVRSEWSSVLDFQLPRFIGAEEGSPISILAFADASQNGYGAVVYTRVLKQSGEIHTSLTCAKSKVSPFKLVTIPRLELCAALLLSRLVKHVVETYQSRIVISKVFAFSDSSTVLCWLQTPYNKDIFVANRVAQIKENIPGASWLHISGKENPADCLSRGLTPKQLVDHPLWTSGPEWTRYPEDEWPQNITEQGTAQELAEGPRMNILVAADALELHPLLEMVERCSSYPKILRITVRVLQFLRLVPRRIFISVGDLHAAELVLFKLIQLKRFSAEIRVVSDNKECSPKLRKLKPFSHEGVLRVGGRLGNSCLTFGQKHQIILPSKETLVEKLIDFNHVLNLHTGAYLLEAILRQKYWILGGRNLIRNRVHRCNKCFRSKPLNQTPVMADLPVHRVSQAKVFLRTGVDYFGPINITLGRKRGAQVHKSYVCLFICMSVKAIHLELVSSLSTAHFIQAFKRFLARRGPCQMMFSDQGSNFVGAKTLLKEINELVTSKEYQEKVQSELLMDGVEWRFNTPHSPHQGGLWESNVKSVKNHLHRIVGEQLLTYEEFTTLLTQVEALLNSRPLCQLSSDATAPEALTPAHFLTLMPLKGFPIVDLSEVPMNRLDRFQLIDRLVQDFWKRWRLEYLTNLQTREKWTTTTQNVEEGTVVILKNDNSPPLHWPLARIVKVHPGKDGVIRNVTVRTSTGSIFARPVVKICPLPSQ